MEEKTMDAGLFEETIRELCTRKDYPLHLAALYGQVNLVKEMLSEKVVLVRELNSLGQSSLHLASARGACRSCKGDLEHPDACFVRDREGMIPLHVAAIKGRVEVLEELVNANKATVFLLTESGEPILHLCANKNKFEALMKLVDLVKDANFVNLRDQEDNTVLHLLSAKENSEVIRFLLGQKNVDLNAVNMDGFTPLDVSVIYTSGIGFVGWKIHFFLSYAGAKRTRFILPPKVAERWLDGHHGSWFFEAMLVLAILMVTVAFQAGLNPPGGVWQDTGYHNVTSDDPSKQVHHFAGESVMSYVNPRSYTLFYRSNNVTLLTSMLVIQTLLIRCFFNSWIFNVIPIILTTISLMAMSATYTNSLSFISPGDTPIAELVLYYPSFILFLATVVHFCRMVGFENIRNIFSGKRSTESPQAMSKNISAPCSPPISTASV
ncbi:LOW QUALITY PROTEIN: ankyrin repeat-containing protein BDA1-like protein [Cinnamomum micranthum f. kanehirae]|uniref:Ankyrin repeat-containing protein BDA1-like protein n=1 Tax=Cinnamomum micranthum f. kanehirae TaxID=337451 RepID=A0A443P0P4_9MAGN|nr:LOW QUALITY PROTEIN: ankyrin repeat-containing protein BDA1-like protein [Cinnamomum micranthum f. kanehirae]